MKRIHTPEAKRYAHHERASVARRIARLVRRKLKPGRLLLIASQSVLFDAYYGVLYGASRGIQALLRMEERHRVRLLADRMAVEREVV